MTESRRIEGDPLVRILEAALLAAGQPLNVSQLGALFTDDERPTPAQLGSALDMLAERCADRGVELVEVASGWRLQVRQDLNEWISRLWEERPRRYSRALLETLALIAYRQPITRGEIEEVRGVSISTGIIRTLQEREWIQVVGHRDVPGKPALFGTTRAFLDYFNLKSLDELPTLAEIRDLDALEPEFEFDTAPSNDDGGDDHAADDGDPDVNEPEAELTEAAAEDEPTGQA